MPRRAELRDAGLTFPRVLCTCIIEECGVSVLGIAVMIWETNLPRQYMGPCVVSGFRVGSRDPWHGASPSAPCLEVSGGFETHGFERL